MNAILITANALLLTGIWFSARNTLLARPLLVLLTVFSLYFVILPLLNNETLYAWRFSRGPDSQLIENYLIGSSIFLVFFFLTFSTGRHIRISAVDRAFGIIYKETKLKGFIFSYLIFLVICFLCQTLLHGSIGYIFESGSAFEVATENSSGRWSLVILGSSLIYPMVLLIGKIQSSQKLSSTLVWTILLSLIYLIICTPSTRTWAAALLLSLLFLYSEKISSVRFFIGVTLSAIVGLVLLIALDIYRLQLPVQDIQWTDFLANIPKSLLLMFSPYENSMLAIDYSDATANFFWFKYLAGAATPLQLLPGALFPFRPDVDKERVLTESVFGQIKNFDFFHDDSTFTFTVMGSGYTDAGYVGVAIAGIIYATLIILVSRGLIFGAAGRLMTYFSLILIFAGYRLSNEVNLQVLYIILMFVIITRMISTLTQNISLRK